MNLREEIEKILDTTMDVVENEDGLPYIKGWTESIDKLESLIRQREEALLREIESKTDIVYTEKEHPVYVIHIEDILSIAQSRGIKLTDHESK